MKQKILLSLIGALWVPVALAQPENLRAEFRVARGEGTLILPPQRNRFSCEEPASPAAVEFAHDLQSASFDLHPFFQTDLNRKPIVIRRAGAIEQNRQGSKTHQSVSTARFSKGFLNAKRHAEETKVAFSGVWFFCEYAGLLEFAGADLMFVGKIGNFTVEHNETLPVGAEGISISFASTKQISSDGKALLRKEGGSSQTHAGIIGTLAIVLSDVAVPFEITGGNGQVMVDMSVNSLLRITKLGDEH